MFKGSSLYVIVIKHTPLSNKYLPLTWSYIRHKDIYLLSHINFKEFHWNFRVEKHLTELKYLGHSLQFKFYPHFLIRTIGKRERTTCFYKFIFNSWLWEIKFWDARNKIYDYWFHSPMHFKSHFLISSNNCQIRVKNHARMELVTVCFHFA